MVRGRVAVSSRWTEPEGGWCGRRRWGAWRRSARGGQAMRNDGAKLVMLVMLECGAAGEMSIAK